MREPSGFLSSSSTQVGRGGITDTIEVARGGGINGVNIDVCRRRVNDVTLKVTGGGGDNKINGITRKVIMVGGSSSSSSYYSNIKKNTLVPDLKTVASSSGSIKKIISIYCLNAYSLDSQSSLSSKGSTIPASIFFHEGSSY